HCSSVVMSSYTSTLVDDARSYGCVQPSRNPAHQTLIFVTHDAASLSHGGCNRWGCQAPKMRSKKPFFFGSSVVVVRSNTPASGSSVTSPGPNLMTPPSGCVVVKSSPQWSHLDHSSPVSVVWTMTSPSRLCPICEYRSARLMPRAAGDASP